MILLNYDAMEKQICKKCKINKELINYDVIKHYKDKIYRRKECKECRKGYYKKIYIGERRDKILKHGKMSLFKNCQRP